MTGLLGLGPLSSIGRTLQPARRLIPGGDIGLSLCVLFQLSILILPIPTFLLDIALAVSFSASILILLISLSLERPLDFSSLPTLLLLTTMLRLSLNVATARLILSHGNEGPYAAGRVVAAFGTFLMGGDVAVGAIVFSMLLMVNFVVITKGSSRIAEVSARFYLDAMPGKQMAIDADLSSGAIDEPTARKRRGELSEESGFYGAMDGASKFVRGDAICALVITLINIVGGLTMGLLRAHMTFERALGTFTTLTIGDGLVSQIPALLVSTAAGIVVSKGATEGNIYKKFAFQLGTNVNALFITAAVAGMFALLPGLPAMPFLVVALLAGAGGWRRSRAQDATSASEPPIIHASEEGAVQISPPDLVRIELGYGLLDLAAGSGDNISERIKRLRRALAMEFGFILPPVRIQDNVEMEPHKYSFNLKDVSAGSGELRPLMFLAISPGDHATPLPGEKTLEPTFGLPAVWVTSEVADQARMANWTVVDPTTVLTTHLAEVVKENVGEFFSYGEAQKILAGLPQDQQKLISELIPSTITMGGLHRILQMLLTERISIRDMATILEGIQEACANNLKSVGLIVGHVRTRLARQICDTYVDAAGDLSVIVLSPEWEEILTGSLVGPADDRQLALGSDKLGQFIDRAKIVVESLVSSGEKPALLTGSQIRYHVHSIVDRIRLNIPVMAQAEIHRRVRVRVVGTI